MGNLTTPPSVQKLQSALHAKAKEEPGYRFYLLYDKVYRADVLEFAYRSCKANKGAAGVDGQRFEDIEAYGQGRWLGELAHRLRTKTYEPNAVKRVWIPKPNSSKNCVLWGCRWGLHKALLAIGFGNSGRHATGVCLGKSMPMPV